MKKLLIFVVFICVSFAGCGDKKEAKTDDSDIGRVDADILDSVDEDEDSDQSEMTDQSEISDQSDTSDQSEESDEESDQSEISDQSDQSEESDEESDTSDESEMSDNDIDNGPEVPLDGFGAISGECGFLDTELTDAAAHYFKNNIDFTTDPYDSEDYQYLTAGGKEIYDDGNLGGSSIYSEMFAYEVLYRCELATLLKTEAEIIYQNTSGKKTDFLAEIDGVKIGVSVTRALKFPFDAEYTVADAENLLNGKLSDILLSSANAAPEDSWEKQILHVIAYSDQHAQSLATAYDSLDSAAKADTVVIVTVSDGDDAFLY